MRRVREQRASRKKIKARKKVEKSQKTLRFFPMLCGSAGSKSNLAKAAGPEPLWCEARVEVKMVKSYFWKLNLPKSAHRCGAKHISKSNVLKLDGLGPLFEV